MTKQKPNELKTLKDIGCWGRISAIIEKLSKKYQCSTDKVKKKGYIYLLNRDELTKEAIKWIKHDWTEQNWNSSMRQGLFIGFKEFFNITEEDLQ